MGSVCVCVRVCVYVCDACSKKSTVLGQKPPRQKPPGRKPRTKTPLAKNPPDQTPPDKTFFSEIL